ncbi:MAG: hypothetical protein HY291_12375 [Planctomycetes bacterium]|nr:hypothetical protein [Planctomycetota bacterium]
MNRLFWVGLFSVGALALFAGRTCAAEDAKPAKAERQAPAPSEKKGDGNWFTNFWTHDVGDTIYHGLKSGSRKVSNAFTGGTKEKDAENDKLRDAHKNQEPSKDAKPAAKP